MFCLCRSPQVVFTTSHDRVLERILLRNAGRNWFKQLRSIEAEEEGTRIPLGTALVDDPVYRRHEKVVRLAHETIADVDDKTVRDGLCFDPIARLGKHLQPALLVLGDESEAFKVSMGPDAVLVVDGLLEIITELVSTSRGIWQLVPPAEQETVLNV